MQTRKCILCGTGYTGGAHGFGLPGRDDCIKSLEIKVSDVESLSNARKLVNEGTIMSNERPGYAGPNYGYGYDYEVNYSSHYTCTFPTILVKGIPRLVPHSATFRGAKIDKGKGNEARLEKVPKKVTKKRREIIKKYQDNESAKLEKKEEKAAKKAAPAPKKKAAPKKAASKKAPVKKTKICSEM